MGLDAPLLLNKAGLTFDCEDRKSAVSRIRRCVLFFEASVYYIFDTILNPAMGRLHNVSIGIPTFNESQNITHLLDSIRNQRLKNGCRIKEIIVSDDSSDNTSTLIRRHFDETNPPYDLKMFHHDVRNGEAFALNEIMMEADGDFLVLYEADTIPATDTTSHLVAPFIRDEKTGITFANPVPTTSRGVSAKAWAYLAKFLRIVRNSDGITRLGVTGRGIALRSIVAKKALIPRWVNSATDLYLPARVLELKYKTEYVDEATVYFRPDENVRDFCLHVLKSWVGHYKLNKYVKRYLPINPSFQSNFKTFWMVASHYPLEALSLFLAIISIPMYAPRIIKKVHTPRWAIATSTKRYPLATEE